MTDRLVLVDTLRGVEGVADADVVDDERGVGTLRLTLIPGADEVTVAMQVNRILRERFGLAVDSGKVQVVEESWDPKNASATLGAATPSADPELANVTSMPAQRPEQDARPAAVPGAAPEVQPADHSTGESHADLGHRRVAQASLQGGRRLAIRRLQVVSTSAGISTAVSLGLDDRTVSGSADGGDTAESVHRAVALATLRAVADVVGERAWIELVDVEVAHVAGEQVAVVVAGFSLGPPTVDDTGVRIERLTGAAVVRDDVRQAIMRAALDAVNRRVETVLDDNLS